MLCTRWCWSGRRHRNTSGPQGRCMSDQRWLYSWAVSQRPNGSGCRYKPSGRTRWRATPGPASRKGGGETTDQFYLQVLQSLEKCSDTKRSFICCMTVTAEPCKDWTRSLHLFLWQNNQGCTSRWSSPHPSDFTETNTNHSLSHLSV